MKIQTAFVDSCITACTGYLVTPQHVEVWCDEGGTARPLTPEEAQQLAEQTDFEERLAAAIQEPTAF